ncbi:MAG: sensor histidine kinase, partial [Caldimonas sp.]
EVHHRIKNNLQGVAGLLQQIAKRKPEVAGAIDEVVGQVHAIAQVYGLQVGDTGPLALARVLEAITASVQRTFGRTIRYRVEGKGVKDWTLPEVEAIPVALTLNELLTNAIKHSPDGDATEEVSCLLEADVDGVHVVISNRAQLPAGFRLARIPNGVSGLGLVRALLPRRNATLRIEQAGDHVLARVDLREPLVARSGGA